MKTAEEIYEFACRIPTDDGAIAMIRVELEAAIRHGITMAAEAAKQTLYENGRGYEGRQVFAVLLTLRDKFKMPCQSS